MRRWLGGVRRDWLRRFPRGHGSVLCLHRVVELEQDLSGIAGLRDLEITLCQLEDLILTLEMEGWHWVPLGGMLGGATGRRRVSLTFDDGYLDNLELAAPLLESHGIPFTVFVTSGFIDREVEPWWLVLGEMVARAVPAGVSADAAELGRWRDEAFRQVSRAVDPGRLYDQAALAAVFESTLGLRVPDLAGHSEPSWFMNWRQVGELAKKPLCTIGCHTMTHRSLGALDAEVVEREIDDSKRRIEAATGAPVTLFAYPHGRPGDLPQGGGEILRRLGIDAGFSTAPRNLTGEDLKAPWTLPRKSIGCNEMEAEVWLDLVAGAYDVGN